MTDAAAGSHSWSSTRVSPGLMALWFAGVTALAAWWCLWRLGVQPFGRDEVATVSDAHRSLGGTLSVVRHREGNMWLYYLGENAWTHLGGTGEGWVRLPAALCAVAAVPALMALARRRFGDLVAIVAGVVLASSVLLVDMAHFARSYGVVALLTVASVLLFTEAVERSRPQMWVAWGVVTGVAMHFHMLASLVVGAEALSLLLLPRGTVVWRELRAGAVVLALLAAPVIAYAATSDSGQVSWIAPISAHALAGFGKAATGSRLLELLVALLFVAVAADVLRELRSSGRSRQAWRRGLVLLWVAFPPLALAVVSVAKPLFQATYLVGVVPGIALLVGVAATSATLRRAAVPAAVAVALVALATQIHRPHPTPASEDLRGAAAFVAAHVQPGDGIAYAPAFARVGFAYYLDRRRTASGARPADLDAQPGQTPRRRGDLFGGEASPARVAANLRAARRVWLVGYPRSPWHPTPEPVLADARLLRTALTRVRVRRFGELTVQLYEHR